jgi:hypothetical protein
MYTNDSHAYYDLVSHFYVLRPEYIRDEYSIELISALDSSGSINARKTAEAFLRRASRTLYNYIYSKHPGEVEYWTWRLVNKEEYRQIILEALGELVYSWLTNNNDMTIQNGISIDTGKLFERIDQIKNQVPLSVEQLLYNAGITVRARTDFDADYANDKVNKGETW